MEKHSKEESTVLNGMDSKIESSNPAQGALKEEESLDQESHVRPHWDYRNAERNEARLFKDGTYQWQLEAEESRILYRYRLDYEAIFPYFEDHIGNGKTLSEKVLKKIDFRLGKFFTFLPENIREDSFYYFSSGIILPSKPNVVFSTTLESSQFISLFLEENKENCAIVEDAMVKSQEYKNNIKNVKMTPYGDETYYFLDKNNSIQEMCPAIKSTGVWHTLVVLTNLEAADKIASLNDELIDQICENAKYVIARIYDGDAYVFWERS